MVIAMKLSAMCRPLPHFPGAAFDLHHLHLSSCSGKKKNCRKGFQPKVKYDLQSVPLSSDGCTGKIIKHFAMGMCKPFGKGSKLQYPKWFTLKKLGSKQQKSNVLDQHVLNPPKLDSFKHCGSLEFHFGAKGPNAKLRHGATRVCRRPSS